MAISSPGNYVIRTSENVLLGIAKEIDLLYYIMKILNCVNIEYLCTQKHGLSIMLFGCHKKKTVVPPKKLLAAFDINNNNNNTNDRNDGNINDIYFHVGKNC